MIVTERPFGLSAFVRCRNEQDYIVASLMSIYRICDEIVVVLNNSTDHTGDLLKKLVVHYDKIRVLEYPHACSAVGPGYYERVTIEPSSSLASYYNWCLNATTFSHVCKWDGDMVATPEFEQVRHLIAHEDVVAFDGYDVLGERTTDNEARIFRYNLQRARYVDWDLYEILRHDYRSVYSLQTKCYLHLKLVKPEWLGKSWVNPNLLATRPVPEQEPANSKKRRFGFSNWQFGRPLKGA